MKSAYFAGGVAALVLSLTPAWSTTVTASLGGSNCGAAGLCTSVAGATTITFDDQLGDPLPYISGIATFGGGGESPFVLGNVSSEFANPPGDDTVYLSIGSPRRSNPVTIDFSIGLVYYGFYLGSPDAHNNIRFYENNVEVASFGGDDLIAQGNGNQQLGAFVNFAVTSGVVDRIVLSSGSAAFETDNHAYLPAGVPEPASMALTGLGLTLGLSLSAGLLLPRKSSRR